MMFALDKATELSVACKAEAAAADDSKDSIRTARHLTIEPGLSLRLEASLLTFR